MVALPSVPGLTPLAVERPRSAVTLLTTFDEEEARTLAQELNQVNEERKALVTEITKEAEAMLDSTSLKSMWWPLVVGTRVWNRRWPSGPTPLKPSLVLTIKEDGIAKGSGRSVSKVNLTFLVTSRTSSFCASLVTIWRWG